MARKLWYEEDPSRLISECRAMETRFPQFRLVRDTQTAVLLWEGVIVSNRGNNYRIVLQYPDDFPFSAPKVYPVEPALQIFRDESAGMLQHQFVDGSLCLFHPDDRFFNLNTTAVTVIAAAAAWFAAYEYWIESNRQHWPGVEAH